MAKEIRVKSKSIKREAAKDKKKTKSIEKDTKSNKLSIAQIENELKRENYKSKYLKLFRSTIYTIIIIAAFTVLLATLVMPVLEIKGDSMNPIYSNGDIAVAFKTKNINTGDVISFYYGNKILVKRVIAKSGDWVNISDDGKVIVNGDEIKEPYLVDRKYDIGDIKYPYQVPDGSWFVMGDNREDTNDSRSSQIGAIKQDDVVGVVLFRVWPLNK